MNHPVTRISDALETSTEQLMLLNLRQKMVNEFSWIFLYQDEE